jgi:hypothetical protein
MRPSSRRLVFQVNRRVLHPELFEVLARHRLQREHYTLELWITRTGHVLHWMEQGVAFAEILAAVDDPLPDTTKLLKYRIQGEHYGSTRIGRVDYQMSFQQEVLEPEIFLRVQNELRHESLKRGILHSFQPHQRLSVAPLSYVNLEGRPGSILTHAFHTFPNENTIVKSQSLIEFA